ncbi:MAG: glutathione S-transferase family protein [Deltaproteobacteria bacterium]|nr:glutathione S-transferase family protein [Deltaproteobacteria bacterium]MDQ3300928.1 glutathione S-transferase family protein [Myxococcota bacterium]
MPTRLVTIPFSHFCEKARWGLERCDLPFEEDAHLPLFSYLSVRRAGGGRTVPVLVDGQDDGKTVIADSTEILGWADDRRPGALLPTDPRDRADALMLEDDFDTHLGPATRRWAYFQLLPRRDMDDLLTRDVPRWQKLALKLTRPLAVGFIKRGLKIDTAGAERSRVRIDDTFARIAQQLGDGRRYLVGERFSVADLTFAALAAPVLLPPSHPTEMPALEKFSEEARAQITAWRASPAGEYGLRMYRDHRDERMTVVVRRGATA